MSALILGSLMAACAIAAELLTRDVRPTPVAELRAFHVGWEEK